MNAVDAVTRDERLARLMLSIASEPGDEVTGWLLRNFGPVETVRLGTDATDARGATSVDMDAWRNRVTPRLSADAARRALDDTDRIGAQLLLPGDAGWPASMAVLGDRAPIALWVLGDPRHLSAEATIGFIGARAASTYGSYAAGVLATDATERGHTVVSGGAYGIDAAAHRAALMAGGATVAVLPGGLDRQYPSGHNQLFEHISKSGALVSELAPDASPTRWRFQERGRLIGALSSAVVVVEAGWRSGALLTARQAADLGRGVGAVPGPITSGSSVGCHRLLRDGIATVVEGMDDIAMLLRRSGAGLGQRLEAPVDLELSSMMAARGSDRQL